MNHPENITFILVVDYFAKKKYEKQNETAILASFSLICTLFWRICTLFWTSTYVFIFGDKSRPLAKTNTNYFKILKRPLF